MSRLSLAWTCQRRSEFPAFHAMMLFPYGILVVWELTHYAKVVGRAQVADVRQEGRARY